MTQTKFIQLIIVSVLAIYGLTPFWCDSCGETYLDSDMTVCDVCGAEVCPVCVDYYEGDSGCFVCDGDASVQGHDHTSDVQPVYGLF